MYLSLPKTCLYDLRTRGESHIKASSNAQEIQAEYFQGVWKERNKENFVLIFFCKNPNSAKNMLIWIKSSARKEDLPDTPGKYMPEDSAQKQTLKITKSY